MQREFYSGMKPLKCEEQTHDVSALALTFRRLNISLAGCSPAEPTSVFVQLQNSRQLTKFTICQKSQPRSPRINFCGVLTV